MKSYVFPFHKIHKDISRLPTSLKSVSLAVFIYYLAWGMIHPYFPIFLEEHVASYTQVRGINALQFFICSFLAIPLGDLIDKIGRKKVLMFSFANYLVLGPLYATAGTLNALIFNRIYNAFTSVGVWVSSTAYIRDVSPKHKEAESIGFFHIAPSFSMVLGPLIGAVLVLFFPIKYLFYSLVFSGTFAVLITMKVPETVKIKESLRAGLKEVVVKDRLFEKEIKDYVSERGLGVKISVLSFLTKFGEAVLLMVLSLLAINIGASLWQIGVIYGLFHIPFITQFSFGELADRIGRKNVLVFGALASSLFFLGLFLTQSLLWLFALSLLVAVGLSAMIPVVDAYVTDLSLEHKGEITGIYQTVGAIGLFTGPFVAGVLSDGFGLGAPFLLCSVLFLGSVWVCRGL